MPEEAVKTDIQCRKWQSKLASLWARDLIVTSTISYHQSTWDITISQKVFMMRNKKFIEMTSQPRKRLPGSSTFRAKLPGILVAMCCGCIRSPKAQEDACSTSEPEKWEYLTETEASSITETQLAQSSATLSTDIMHNPWCQINPQFVPSQTDNRLQYIIYPSNPSIPAMKSLNLTEFMHIISPEDPYMAFVLAKVEIGNQYLRASLTKDQVSKAKASPLVSLSFPRKPKFC